MSVTVNQFVCLFPSGTRIKVHMIFADRKKTEQYNDEDFGVWGGGDYYGITRHPVGECTVREARMLEQKIKNHPYDLDVWAFEPKYCDNLKKLQGRQDSEETEYHTRRIDLCRAADRGDAVDGKASAGT